MTSFFQRSRTYELPDEWNVTPLSKDGFSNIQLWHYNDSYELTRVIKNNLNNYATVIRTLKKLSINWSQMSKTFQNYYEIAIREYPFSMFIR